MDQVKHLLFDFGGVILQLYPEQTDKELGNLLGIKLDWGNYPEPLQSTMESLEVGEITFDEFHTFCSSYYAVSPHLSEFTSSWNAMLGSIPTDNLELLRELRKKYTITLLSNINSVHLQKFHEDFKRENGSEINFENDYFDHVFYSHELGLRKPNAEVFIDIVQKTGYSSHQTLFIDDTLININVAKQLKFKTLHHNRNQNLKESLSFLRKI